MDLLFAKRYEIIETIGEGSMGKVLKAHDTWLGRPVAIKVLKPSLLENKNFSNAIQPLKRFFREARELARLDHYNIVPVYDLGEEDGKPYIIMPFICGLTLDKCLSKKNEIDRFSIAADICDALSYAHSTGIVHRDLKPSNIIITSEGRAKVMDFGLARRIDSNTDLTASSSIIGTVTYISPEQAICSKVDHRADLYSLGVILYEIFTGYRPFKGDNPVTLVLQHLNVSPRSPAFYNHEIDPRLEKLILKLLEKKPENRYYSAGDVSAELKSIREIPLKSSVSSPEKREDSRLNIRLVGRDITLARMAFLVDRLNKGRGGLCILKGPAGTGKSRILYEISNFALIRNIKFFTQDLGEMDNLLTFYSLDAFANKLIFSSLPSAESNITPLSFPRDYLPDKEELFAGCGLAYTGDKLFEKFKDCVEYHSKPMIFLIDDISLATYDTQRLFSHLIMNSISNRLPVLWILTFEEFINSPDHPFFETVNKLYKEKELELVTLELLDLKQTAELCEEILEKADINEKDLKHIYKLSGGNPFLLKLIIENRLWQKLDNTFDIYKDIWEINFKDEFNILPFLIACDGKLDKDMALEISGEDISEKEMIFSDILSYDRDTGVIKFNHPLYKKILYDKITFSEKVDYHRKIAYYFEKKIEFFYNPEKLDFYIMALTGYHFLMGQVYSKAIHYLAEFNSIVFSAGACRDAIHISNILLDIIEKSEDFLKKKRYKRKIEKLKSSAEEVYQKECRRRLLL